MSDESGEDRTSTDRSDDRRGRDRSDGDRSGNERWGREPSDGPDGDDADRGRREGDMDRPEDGATDEVANGDADEEYEPSVAGVFGARPEDAPPRPEIVPESPDLENVLFVLLGVLFGLFVIYRAVAVFAA